MADPSKLSRRERQIMEILYARTGNPTGGGEAPKNAPGVSASDVHADLPDPPSRTSIRTTLRILEHKGHLTHTLNGREFLYRPVAPRGKIGRSALQSVLRAFFANSLPNALAAYFADSRTSLSPEEARQLKTLIDQVRKRGD